MASKSCFWKHSVRLRLNSFHSSRRVNPAPESWTISRALSSVNWNQTWMLFDGSLLFPCFTAFLMSSLICCSRRLISRISVGAFWTTIRVK